MASFDRVFYNFHSLPPPIPTVLGEAQKKVGRDENNQRRLFIEKAMRIKNGDWRYNDVCLESSNKQESRVGCEKNEREFIEKQQKEKKSLTQKQLDPPKPKTAIKSKPRHPMPYIFKIVNGRRVCSNNNDKPSYSKKNDKIHLDMECCLDPDEIPNSNCYYDPKKYGKYL